jgi:cytosine/adenosine deaminase-related metal-dependent hydrolase
VTTTETVAGTILTGESLEPIRGRVVVEDDRIAAVEETDTDATNIVAPAFVNAHTHLGDSVAKDAAADLGLEAAVAPPDSRKHRRLAAASRDDLVAAMRQSLRFARSTGTAACVDFRENGVDGARALRDAADPLDIDAVVLGSDDPEVLDVADGYGASGANDDDFAQERAAARAAGKPFAIHAGEPDASDIHPALDLDPDLLVHMVHASDDHLDRVADQSVPIVACPRANATLGVGTPPLRDLLDHTTVALGTDNVMLNAPSMLREMAYTATRFDVSSRDVLRMATVNGADAAGLDCGVVEPGRRAALVVFDADSDNLAGSEDPVEAVVRRATALDIERVLG